MVFGVDMVQCRVDNQQNQHRHNSDVVVGLKSYHRYACQGKRSNTITCSDVTTRKRQEIVRAMRDRNDKFRLLGWYWLVGLEGMFVK